jgi:Fe-S oxidoreductase
VIRLDALKATGAKRIAVSCPHCLTMLESAKATARDDATRVEDIAEIVAADLTERAEPAEGVGSEPAE